MIFPIIRVPTVAKIVVTTQTVEISALFRAFNTHFSIGRNKTFERTLGIFDFIRVPSPAAKTIEQVFFIIKPPKIQGKNALYNIIAHTEIFAREIFIYVNDLLLFSVFFSFNGVC